MSVASFAGVGFAYGQHAALRDVSFELTQGDYLGIIGPNGSGKTTLLRILLGLLLPTKGTVKLFGQAPDQVEQRWRIGYVPQRVVQADFQFPATVREVVSSGRTATRSILQFPGQSDVTAIETAMKRTGVTKLADRLISDLSGGERQRVFIARSLASEPTLLVLDEPTVGVDITSQERFYTLLCELNTQHGLTIVLVSHDIDVIAQEVSSILFLNHTVVGYGPAKELMQDKYLAKLYGNQMKFITHHH